MTQALVKQKRPNKVNPNEKAATKLLKLLLNADYKKAFKFSDDDVEMHSYQIPENFNLDDLIEKTTKVK